MQMDVSKVAAYQKNQAMIPVKNEAVAAKNEAMATSSIFGEKASLTIEERERLALGGELLSGVDEVEEGILSRGDALGALMSETLQWDPPEMPNFV